MKTFRRDEIENRHGQRIYMFSKQPGSTELEKCKNFLAVMNENYKEWKLKTSTDDLTILVTSAYFEVFISDEKVGEIEIDYKPKDVNDLIEDLESIGFTI